VRKSLKNEQYGYYLYLLVNKRWILGLAFTSLFGNSELFFEKEIYKQGLNN